MENLSYFCSNSSRHAYQRCVPRRDFVFLYRYMTNGCCVQKYTQKFGEMEKLSYFCSTRTPKPLNDAKIGGRFIF